jgi:predicted DNA-binding ribbon-helix-helix protein
MNKLDARPALAERQRPAGGAVRHKQSERGLRSGNIVVNGHRTSIRLEPEMWTALAEIAGGEGLRVNELVSNIASRTRAGSLTSAVRVFIMAYYRTKAHALAAQNG